MALLAPAASSPQKAPPTRLLARLAKTASMAPPESPARQPRITQAYRPPGTGAEATAAPQNQAPPRPGSWPTLPVELPAPLFIPSEQLTAKPEPLNSISPDTIADFPEAMPGKLILTLWIDQTGKVINVHPESGTLPEALVQRIVSSFEQLAFKPGELDGKPVGTVMRIELSVE